MTTVLWRGSWAARIRIVSGLCLMFYVVAHLLNIASVLISPDVAEAFQKVRLAITRSTPVEIMLGLALGAHIALALSKLVQRRSFRLPLVDWVQILMGVAIPLMLSSHIIYTNIAHQTQNVNTQLGYVTTLIWGSRDGWLQALLLCVTWVHGCIGVHMWLRLTQWWRRIAPFMLTFAVLIPTLALLGYVTAARAIDGLLSLPRANILAKRFWDWPNPEGFTRLAQIDSMTDRVIFGILLALLAAILVRRIMAAIRKPVRVTYVGGPVIRAPRHQTVLETSQGAGIKHIALCGGRGRCTTCRVIIEAGAENLPPPSPAELRSLTAVDAPPNARLACQVRPTGPVTVFRVFREDGKLSRAHASQGKEAQLAVLFLDMRGFTERTDGQLPYDVVFLLNRFFDDIVPPILAAGGTVDKYMGDGLMAVFEKDAPNLSARAALRAVAGIGQALDSFNDKLKAEGSAPVAIGIGVHLGNVVLGEIGTADRAPRTLIGDTVNVASRLETETKVLGVQALISRDTLKAAQCLIAPDALMSISLRGLETDLQVLALRHATQAAQLDTTPA